MRNNRQMCGTVLCLLWVCFSGFCQSLDRNQSEDVFYRLVDEEGENLEDLIKQIQENPDDYEPPVIFALANKLFLLEQKEEAVFWFYLAQVRSLYAKHLAKANLQETGQGRINLYLNNFGASIKPYALSQPQLLAGLMDRIKTYLDRHQENYNLLWLYSQEEELSDFAKKHFKPKNEWKAIRYTTYQSFFKRVEEVLCRK